MATQLQIRRGTSAQIAAFTGAEGEIVVNTTNDSVHVNDGSTAGGFEMARADLNNVSDTSLNAALTGNTVSALTVTALTAGGAETDAFNSSGTTLEIKTGARVRGAGGGDFQVSSGAANDSSEPTYTFRGDPDTGIFWGGANTVGVTTGGNQRINIASNGDISFYEDTGTTPKLFWDASAESLGIGTISPVLPLDIVANGGANALSLRTRAGDDYSFLTFRSNDGSEDLGGLTIHRTAALTSNLLFYTNNGGSAAERLRIGSSGNVGIGTASPTYTLSVNSGSSTVPASLESTGTDSWLMLKDTNTTLGHVRLGSSSNSLIAFAGGSERMRIDSSGNLLVGKTSTSIGTAGHTIFASGEVFHTVAGTPLYVNRTGSDGSIQNFYKDGTTVGSIGTTTNSYLHVGGTNTGIFFYNNGFGPCAGSSGAGALNDGTKDIGASGNRFKDLYLSGDIAHKDAAGNARLLYDKSSNLLGNVGTNGTFATLSKSSGSFRIDHPLPAKTETHHLVHSFVEAPQADNIYRGKVELVDGSATVNIDTAAGMTEGTYVLLNTNTQCFTSNESGWTAIKGSVSGNTLTITAQDNTCTDTISWMVIGERHDQHMFDTSWTDENGKVIVEPLKENN